MPHKVGWYWPDFKPEEVLSPMGLKAYQEQGVLLFSPLMLSCLQQFRQKLQLPMLINHAGLKLRGYRSCAENKQAGGVDQSMHLMGLAADCTVLGLSVAELAEKAEKSNLFSGLGVYIDKGFVHLDARLTTDGRIRKWEG